MKITLLLIGSALAGEPKVLDPTDGLLLSIFLGYGSGHFYARNPRAGGVFLTTQVLATAIEIAAIGRVFEEGVSLDRIERARDIVWVSAGVLATSRVFEVATVIPAIERYNGASTPREWARPVVQRPRPLSELEWAEIAEDESYQGDSVPALPSSQESPQRDTSTNTMSARLTSIIYTKVGRAPDSERAEVETLVLGLLESGYLPAAILTTVERGIDSFSDPAAVSVCAILRAGITNEE